jgi:hypothetical protein
MPCDRARVRTHVDYHSETATKVARTPLRISVEMRSPKGVQKHGRGHRSPNGVQLPDAQVFSFW